MRITIEEKRLREIGEEIALHSFGSPEYRALLEERVKLAGIVARQQKTSGIIPNHPPSEAFVSRRGISVGDLAKALYPDTPVDTALPQDWVNACLARGYDPRGSFVWGYPSGYLFGQPLPLTREAAQRLPGEMI